MMSYDFFFNIQLSSVTPLPLQDGYRQPEDSKRYSLDDLALFEGFARVLEDLFLGKELYSQGLGLLAARSHFVLYM